MDEQSCRDALLSRFSPLIGRIEAPAAPLQSEHCGPNAVVRFDCRPDVARLQIYFRSNLGWYPEVPRS